MKAFITFLCLVGLLTSCEDELIAFYEEPREETIVNPIEEKIDESRSDSIIIEQGTPIGFTVNVNDYKEYGDI